MSSHCVTLSHHKPNEIDINSHLFFPIISVNKVKSGNLIETNINMYNIHNYIIHTYICIHKPI